MSKQWDGRPSNPKRDGWHWLKRAKDGLTILKRWDAEAGAWEDGIMLSPATVMEWGVCYVAPCLTSAEVTAQVEAARLKALEESALIAKAFADEALGWLRTELADATREARWNGRVHASQEIAAAILEERGT